MGTRKIGLSISIAVLSLVSCNNDDDAITRTPPRDRAEQQIADNDSILNYFNTHYYNASDFDGVDTPKIKDLVLDTIPDGKVKLADELYDAVNNPNGKLIPYTVTYAKTEYIYYVLELNKGGGDEAPHFCDKVRVLYEGSLVSNDKIFDSAITPIDLDLVGNTPTSGTIFGWRLVFPQFNPSETIGTASDGTRDYTNHGTGVMFLPSGLAYFSNSTTGIPAYSPLVFKFELLQSFVNDHDDDGVPSYLEDIFTIDGIAGSDGEFTIDGDDRNSDTDDDTDNDGTPDYVDTDDDGDGVSTEDEDLDGDGDPTNDIGPNNKPRYLDPKAKESKP